MTQTIPAPSGDGTLLAIARKKSAGAPMELIDMAEVSVQEGLAGDYRGRSRRRQITVLSLESWEAACKELGTSLPWTTRRANLLVDRIPLAETDGRLIKIGNLTLSVTGETPPCNLMDEACYGLREKLVPDWRGGVTCQVVQGGTIQIGDLVSLEG